MKLTRIISACFCFTLLLMNTQCDEDDNLSMPACDQPVVIDNGFYQTAESGAYDLVLAYVDYSCLAIQVSASGCDGNSWSMVLVDSGDVAESFPAQRFLKFVFTNDETCLAVFNQERSFNLTSLQIDGENELILNIDGFPEPLTYIY